MLYNCTNCRDNLSRDVGRDSRYADAGALAVLEVCNKSSDSEDFCNDDDAEMLRSSDTRVDVIGDDADLNYVIVATIDRLFVERSNYHSNNNSINLYKNPSVSVAHNRNEKVESLISATLPCVKTLLLCSPTLFQQS